MRSAKLVVAFVLAAPAALAQGPEGAPEKEAFVGESPAPRKMTFDEAVRRALAHNPTLETAQKEIVRAEGLAQQTRAGWYPTLAANATYTRLDNDRVFGGRVVLAKDNLNANLALTVPLVAARAWANHAHAKNDIEVARRAADDARRQVAVATGRAYLTLVQQHRMLESAERSRDTAKALEAFAKDRLEGGVGNRLDYVRASQERATAEAAVRTQLIGLTTAEEALGVLVGEDRAVEVTGVPVLAAPPSLSAALGQATSRADVVAQRERVEAARQTARDTYVEYLPILSAVGQPFYQNPATLTQPTTGWQAQLIFSLPLFDGGARYGLADQRRAVHAEEKAALEGALRQARSDVRVAFESLRHSDESLAFTRDAAKLARESLELAQIAYRAGATSNLEVIDAESRSRSADSAEVVAEGVARIARLDLLAACGRFP